MKESFNIQELLHHKSKPMQPSSLRAFQRQQEHNLKHPGLVDLITTKQTTFFHRQILGMILRFFWAIFYCNAMNKLVPCKMPFAFLILISIESPKRPPPIASHGLIKYHTYASSHSLTLCHCHQCKRKRQLQPLSQYLKQLMH